MLSAGKSSSLARLVILPSIILLLAASAQSQQYSLDLPEVAAKNPGVFTSKQNAFSKATGLSLQIKTHGFKEVGYRPLELKVSAEKASNADRSIIVQITKNNYRSPNNSTEVNQYKLILPAGLIDVTKQVYLPPYDLFEGSASINTLVDGKQDKALSIRYTGIFQNANQNGNWNSNWARCYIPYGEDLASLQGTKERFSLRGPQLIESFSEDWLFYTSADAVIIPAGMLERTIELNPSRIEGLKEWVKTGGNLWITRCKRSKLSQEAIVELLDLERWSYNQSLPNTQRKPDSAGWHNDSLIRKDSDRKKNASESNLLESSETSVISMVLNPDTKGWYAWYPYGFGRVYAFEKHPLEGHSSKPKMNQTGYEKISERNWTKRHGVGPGCQSSQFADLLIPGIGMAPVLEFQGLITLFVLLIGPLNYWLLWRADRVHLFVLTTPLFAGIVTLCLMGYGVVCDGFGNQARARSITYLNQAEGKAVSWSRMTHYSGSAPREGLTIPESTAIYPILPVYDLMGGASRYERLTEWKENQQIMKSGWFPSRTAVQFLAIKSADTKKNVQVLAGQDRTEVKNNLGVPIDMLLVQREKGDWYSAESIANEKKVVLKQLSNSVAITKFRILVVENQPVMPEGGDPETASDIEILNINRSRNFSNRQELSANLLNQEFNRLAGVDGSQGLEVPPFSYVAVTSQAVETPFGIENVVESGSFHVTVGRWQ